MAGSFVANRVSRGIAGFGAQVAANPLTNRKKTFRCKRAQRAQKTDRMNRIPRLHGDSLLVHPVCPFVFLAPPRLCGEISEGRSPSVDAKPALPPVTVFH
jgi:hypothetical protein